MLRILVFALVVAALVSQLAIPSALALGEPAGGCAPAFSLEPVMEHDDHQHLHVGTDADFNGDGYVCMKHVTPGESVHVHVDNDLP